ncbi:gastrokine-1-like [Pleurodeles waltl]|uniref:gastrokine-1-like n=1 Tax=Pleurodeles waltl TaxID=8319 RepID=UPI003709C0A1
MKIFLSALLAALLIPSLADDSVTLTNQGNDGGSVHQTVNINNEKNIANINTNAGMNSWNSIWDYNTVSTTWFELCIDMKYMRITIYKRIHCSPAFAKKSCYIHRMNRNVVPSIQELARLTKEKKDQKAPAGPPPRSLQYSVTSAKAENFEEYGKPIEAMCRGVPSYVTEEDQGNSFFFGIGGCEQAQLLFILNISVCGGIGF